MNKIYRKILTGTYDLCDLLEEKSHLREKLDLNDNIHLRNILEADIMSYLAYLAASDGVISWKECRYMRGLFDLNITAETLNEFIREKNIYSVDFEEKVPLTLQLFVALDNVSYKSGEEQGDTELGSTLVQLYVLLTKGLIAANDKTKDSLSGEEKQNMNLYLGMLRTYIEDNTDSHHVDVLVGYTKRPKSDDIEIINAADPNTNTSVKAPRKR